MKAIFLITALIATPLVANSYSGDNDKVNDFRAPDYETSGTTELTDHSKWGRGTGESTGAISFTSHGHQGEKKMWIKSTTVGGGETCNGTPKECSGGGR